MRDRQGRLICSRRGCARPILDVRKAYRKGADSYYCESCHAAEFQKQRREVIRRQEEREDEED